MGPFESSYWIKYILVAIDYVSKWVEAIAPPNNKVKSVTANLKEKIFSRFGTLRAIITNCRSHFCNKLFRGLLEKYSVCHNVANPCHQRRAGKLRCSIVRSSEFWQKW